MPIELIKNQPILFNRAGAPESQCVNCNDEEFCVPVRPGDYTQFQFKITPCEDSVNVALNSGFDEATPIWSTGTGGNTFFNDFFGTGVGLISMDNTTTTSLFQPSVLTVGDYYEVSIDVKYGGGEQLLLAISSIGGSFVNATKIGPSPSTVITEGFTTYKFYGYATTDFLSVLINADVLNSAVIIDNVTAKPIDLGYAVAICDTEGAIIKNFDVGTEISGAQEFAKLTDDRITVTIDWSSEALPFECYNLCLYDPCDPLADNFYNLQNAGFQSAIGWNIFNGGAVIVPGELRYENPTLNTIVTNSTNLVDGDNYDITIEITKDVNCLHQLELEFQGQHTVTNPTGTSTFSVVGNGADFFLRVTNIVVDSACADDPCLSIGSISIVNTSNPNPPTYISNCFSLKQSSCALLIEACNDSTAFDIMPEENFIPNVRVEGVLKNATYDIERSMKVDSKGRARVNYFRRTKIKELVLDYQPEFILDFLSLTLGFNHFYVDGVQYVVEDDEFQPVYDEGLDNSGRVSILVREKEELVENSLCTEEADGCIPRNNDQTECNLPSIGAPDGSFSIYNPQTGALLDQL